LNNHKKRLIRKIRTRKKISGTENRPRLSVFRSLNHIYAQIINDESGNTLTQANSTEVSHDKNVTKTKIAAEVGKLLGERANEKKITAVVFDKNGYKFHGRIKALADSTRKEGVQF
jgi:large subunit ribosomal protein L18